MVRSGLDSKRWASRHRLSIERSRLWPVYTDLVLVTTNETHFGGFKGLLIENWSKP